MELNERIASVRKAAGLTQEQLGELVGVSRQAVSKWESGQAVPDALTITALCQKLHVSADYLLLGVDPDTASGSAASAYTPPDTCPCCGRHVGGTICPVCGYALPTAPPRGPKYAIYSAGTISKLSEAESDLQKYCGYSEEYAAPTTAAGSCCGGISRTAPPSIWPPICEIPSSAFPSFWMRAKRRTSCCSRKAPWSCRPPRTRKKAVLASGAWCLPSSWRC